MTILDGQGAFAFWIVVSGDNPTVYPLGGTVGTHTYYYPTMTVYLETSYIDQGPPIKIPATIFSYHSAIDDFMGGFERLAYRPNQCAPTPTPSPRVDTVHSLLSHEVLSESPQEKAVVSHQSSEVFVPKKDLTRTSYHQFDVIANKGKDYIYYSNNSMDLMAESRDQRFTISAISQDFIAHEDPSNNKYINSFAITDLILSEPSEKHLLSYDLIGVFKTEPEERLHSQHKNLEVFAGQNTEILHNTLTDVETLSTHTGEILAGSYTDLSVFNHLPPAIKRLNDSAIYMDVHISKPKEGIGNISTSFIDMLNYDLRQKKGNISYSYIDMFNYNYLNLAATPDHTTIINNSLENRDIFIGRTASSVVHEGLDDVDVLQGRIEDIDVAEDSLYMIESLLNDPYKLNISAILLDIMTRQADPSDEFNILVIPTRYIIP